MTAQRRLFLFALCAGALGLVVLHSCSQQIGWIVQTAGNHVGLLVSRRFQNYEVLFRDYGHLEQYREANARLPTASNRVVLVGDSITAFWADPANSAIQNAEPTFVFRAVGGSTTGQMLLRFRQDVINLHPRVVVILAGTNNVLIRDDNVGFDTFRNDIMTMCEMASDHHISIILGSLPPLTDIGHKADLHHMRSIPLWNNWLRSYAKSIGAGFTDYYPSLVGPHNEFRTELTYDNIHPNRAGYSHMEPILLSQVKRVESAFR